MVVAQVVCLREVLLCEVVGRPMVVVWVVAEWEFAEAEVAEVEFGGVAVAEVASEADRDSSWHCATRSIPEARSAAYVCSSFMPATLGGAGRGVKEAVVYSVDKWSAVGELSTGWKIRTSRGTDFVLLARATSWPFGAGREAGVRQLRGGHELAARRLRDGC